MKYKPEQVSAQKMKAGLVLADSSAGKRGVALVMVLGFVALIAILVTAFFSSATTELASSKSYSDGAAVKGLSDSAVNSVMGIIREATSGGSKVAWASQPGMLRTYDDAGKMMKAYKLYSSDRMTVSAFDPADDVDIDWNKKPGLYTDLNKPISETLNDGSSVLHYPIVDPAAADPATAVEGFSLVNAPGYDKSKPVTPANNPATMPVKWIYILRDGTMTAPVEYKDGVVKFSSGAQPSKANPIVSRMAFWTDDETAKVNINTASEGTFWDVPVCNTQPPGGGFSGTYMADPAKNIYEFDLAEFQGASKEYQRYPGHPATTCLSTVFGNSLGALYPSITRAELIKKLTDISPRITVYDKDNIYKADTDPSKKDLSSWGGTRRGGPEIDYNNVTTLTETAYAGFRLSPDGDRLYASVDELMFAPPVTAPTTTSTRPERPLAPTNSKWDSRRVLEQARFFVTAQSRAPEVNLFNKPRVAIWPLQATPDTRPASYRPFSGSGNRTYFDKLVAFCASIGERSTNGVLTPYYFTREDPMSTTKDWSLRNQEIYKYLQALTDANTPGFGKNFAAKYGKDERDQILTEIFDYIRCTNLIDYSDSSAANAAYTPTGYKYVLNTTDNQLYLDSRPVYKGQNPNHLTSPYQNTTITSRGQVVPIEPPLGTPGAGTRGIGRIATLSELALVVIRTGPRKDGQPFDYKLDPPPLQDDTKSNLQVALIPQLFSPMAGWSALANNIRIRFKNISIMVNGVDAFASNRNQSGMYDAGRIPNSKGVERKTGGGIGYRALLEPDNVEGHTKASPGAPVDSLPAYANMTISQSSIKTDGYNMTVAEAVANGKTMTIGGSVDVEIEAPANPNPNIAAPVIQKFRFTFPTTTVPIPNRVWVPTPIGPKSNVAAPEASIVYVNSAGVARRGGRFPPNELSNGVYTYTYKDIFFTSRRDQCNSFDVVRSVVPVSAEIMGDLRHIAAKPSLTNEFLPPLKPAGIATQPYFDSKCAGVHSMRRGEPDTANGSYYTSGGYGPDRYGPAPAATSPPTPPPAQPIDRPISNGAAFGSLLESYPVAYANSAVASSLSGNYLSTGATSTTGNAPYIINPTVPEGILGVKNSMGEPGDWDNGPGTNFDGPLCNKADEGNDKHRHHGMFGTGDSLDKLVAKDVAYIGGSSEDTLPQYAAFFSPNRMMPSPVMFGSLPTGVKRGLPWQTLLFRPAVSYLPGKTNHPGGSSGGAQVPDHLMLDLFWMPVVEPYAISEPMATAGKVNMNYQIVPFSHIKRDTGLRAVMKTMKVTALNPNSPVTQPYNANKSGILISDYKRCGNVQYGNGGGVGAKVRYNINMNETLKQFDTERFDKKKAFVSASEICELPLVPDDPSVTSASNLSAFWAKNTMTGDNSLERPYAHLYSRLTTKSNTYTVHVWVETLKQGVSNNLAESDSRWAEWNEQTGQVTAQYRGSTLIERYIDPQDPRLAKFDETYTGATVVDSAGNITKAGSLDPFYRFRVLNTKRFDR